MKTLICAALGMALAWGTPALMSQQSSPNQDNSSQKEQDVPKGTPGEKSPDLKQSKPNPPSPGTGTEENNQNVPHHTPGPNNPDLEQQHKPAPKKKSKKKQNVAPPSSQPSGTPHV